ncbi:hypothetical protein BDN72DRAFT_780104, partial [Pluteus cervinus]
FISFLQDVLPVLSQPFSAFETSPNLVLKAISHKPDFFLPFRQLAPTIIRAESTIFSRVDRLNTTAGLFNAVAFRAVFYGSDWAREHLRWFENYKEWQDYYKINKQPEPHYVNKGAYGAYMANRSIEWLKGDWDKAVKAVEKGAWAAIVQKAKAGDIQALFDFLCPFTGIGKLSALLIIGDLVECGFIPMPSAEAWGALIAAIERGGQKGLVQLGLVDLVSAQSVASAFASLHTHVLQVIPSDQLRRFRYDVITLEHAVCKYSRALKYNYIR